ncbi:BTB/POZ domain-containing protein 2-like [Gigantopelta aegis]|uniref:BTB/POZ domain-containing protein 2-like n=1 Tax=Gigantopelta aegis TaxID=1735272 RepID=UPI001B88755B|nr:BTB/POZ domain-containing protein 2-like [Gigantopelta aegis]XP_041360437.1 BTB/POZ domain-containing protein 2-like [Gigantopelta aegis]
MSSQNTTTDWQSGRDFAETNLYMLEHEITCDVTFRVGTEQTTVRAHRFMLISRSHVFSAMLCGPLAETGEIEIPDVDGDSFSLFLRFVYTNDVIVEPNTVMHLLYLAKKYNIVKLRDQCLIFLNAAMTVENMFVLLEQAKMFDEKWLIEKVMEFIDENGASLVKSPGFLDLSRESVVDIIKSDDLEIEEVDVFHVVNNWAEHQCQKQAIAVTPEAKREVLGPVMELIRFSALPLEFIVDVVDASGLLTPIEQLGVLQHSICPDKKPGLFCTKKRITKCKTVYRFKTVSLGIWTPTNKTDALSFKCNKPIRLRGFMLYGPKKEECGNFNICTKLLDTEGNALLEMETKPCVEKTKNKMFSVYFPNPVNIGADKLFTLVVNLGGSQTYWGKNDSTQVNVDDYIFDFFDSDLREFDKQVSSTRQIPALIFSQSKFLEMELA